MYKILVCIIIFSVSFNMILSFRYHQQRIMYMKSTINEDFDTEIRLGPYKILSIDDTRNIKIDLDSVSHKNTIQLIDIKSGWGNGAHPTTKLCLEFVKDKVKDGDIFLDYGCGSGVLSILAAKLGASKCLGVDIDEDSLSAAIMNAKINNVSNILEIIHTKTVYIGDNSHALSDVTVANILPGPLSRLVVPLWMLTKPGGYVCLSGLRPIELPGIRRIYEPFMDITTEETKIENHPIYGDWVRWTVRTKNMTDLERKEALNRLTQSSVEY